MSDTFLATKTSIPPLRRNLVTRPHLVQRLNQGITQNSRLILISAPAGYGKSTQLSEWVSQLEAPVAWLSLEKGENNPVRFWSYFATALSTLPQIRQASIGGAFFQSIQSPRPKPMDELLTDFVNDLCELDVGPILVLDDLHSIRDGKIHQDLVFLIDHLKHDSRGLHLVVASRMDPPWPLARWRVRDELIEVRTKDLRFSPEETITFFNKVMGLKLTPRDTALLEQRTEGWIAGLQMAALSMQSREDQASFLDGFSGTHRFILEYLLEEVLSQQTAEVQDFLLQTSLLQYLTAPLCDAITGRDDSEDMLLQLEKSNMFLVPLDEERRWYRYHHLFADLLRKRLKQSQSERITGLHQRASNWYAENNMLSEAIIQALEAGHLQRVNEFVSGNAMAIVDHFELLDVLRYFEELPGNQISQNPWLGIAYAWTKAYADPSPGIDWIIVQAEAGLYSIDNTLERQRIISHLNAIRAYVAWVKGDPDGALEYAQNASENLPSTDWMTRAHLLNIMGLAQQYTEDLPSAIRSFESAIVAGERTGTTREILPAMTNLAYLYYLQGKLHQAFLLCQQARNLKDKPDQDFNGSPVLAHAYGTMSLVQLQWNEMKAAIISAEKSVALAEQWKQADGLHFALTCLSKIYCAIGDLEKAFATNQRAMQLSASVSPWYLRLSAYNEISLNLHKGDLAAAYQRLQQIEPQTNDRDKKYTFMITKATLLLAQGRYGEVLTELENLVYEHEQKGVNWYLLNLLPLQALALHALGREEEALKVISHCLSLAEPEGYVWIFVERGTPMLRLLQRVASREIQVKYISRLLPAFNTADSLQRPSITKKRLNKQIPALIEPLSQRELQVLRLLNSSLTSTEIGQELYVSQNTVRTHIRNIYSKLAVHGRIEAIQKAKGSGLI